MKFQRFDKTTSEKRCTIQGKGVRKERSGERKNKWNETDREEEDDS